VRNEVMPLNNSIVAFASAVPEMVILLVSLVRLSLLLLPLSSSLAKSKLIGAVGLEVSMVTVAVANSNLVATFSEAIAKGTGDIVIKESGGTITFATLGIQSTNITIGGTDNKTLTINPNTNLESGKCYYIEMASGVLTDVAGNNFAGIDDCSASQLPALSMLIALIKALLTVCTTLSVEKDLISEID
jgi:hypothetical protein